MRCRFVIDMPDHIYLLYVNMLVEQKKRWQKGVTLTYILTTSIDAIYNPTFHRLPLDSLHMEKKNNAPHWTWYIMWELKINTCLFVVVDPNREPGLQTLSMFMHSATIEVNNRLIKPLKIINFGLAYHSCLEPPGVRSEVEPKRMNEVLSVWFRSRETRQKGTSAVRSERVSAIWLESSGAHGYSFTHTVAPFAPPPSVNSQPDKRHPRNSNKK